MARLKRCSTKANEHVLVVCVLDRLESEEQGG